MIINLGGLGRTSKKLRRFAAPAKMAVSVARGKPFARKKTLVPVLPVTSKPKASPIIRTTIKKVKKKIGHRFIRRFTPKKGKKISVLTPVTSAAVVNQPLSTTVNTQRDITPTAPAAFTVSTVTTAPSSVPSVNNPLKDVLASAPVVFDTNAPRRELVGPVVQPSSTQSPEKVYDGAVDTDVNDKEPVDTRQNSDEGKGNTGKILGIAAAVLVIGLLASRV